MQEVFTVGQLARRIGVRRDRLAYAIDRADIRPVGRAGILRLFSLDQLEDIQRAVESVRPYRPETWAVELEQGGDDA